MFDVYGQKIVDANTGKLYGIELLARPKSGLDIDLDKYFLHAETSFILNWLMYQLQVAVLFNNETGVKCCVNVDNHVIDKLDLEQLAFVVHDTGIELEMTQVRSLPHFNKVNALRTGKTPNLKIALDDFMIKRDTTMECIEEYDFDTIKLDRISIMDVENDSAVVKRLQKIHDEIKSRGMNCIVEGVENKEQLKALRSIGFNLFQGFYFHRPQKIDILLRELKNKGT